MVNKIAKTVVFFVMAILHFSFMAIAGDSPDISEILARATYKIEGEGSMGTAFFVGIPIENDPYNCFPVLVTASHVLNNIKGDKAVLYLRKKVGGLYKKVPFELTIRADGKNLWVSHEDADVAVMRIREVPEEIDKPALLAFSAWLANDGYLEDVRLHPGDEFLCLGYPLGQEANDAGFPILRGGKISYPMLPTRKIGRISLGLEVFNGDSGGPVYFYHKGSARRDEREGGVYTYQFIVGLMKSVSFDEHVARPCVIRLALKKFWKAKEEKKLLKLAEVVPSVFIKEAIELLLSREKPSVFTKEAIKPLWFQEKFSEFIQIPGDKNVIYQLSRTDPGVSTAGPPDQGEIPGIDSGK